MSLAKFLTLCSVWKTAVLLLAVCEVALSQAGQCSEGGSNCVLPQPKRDHTGGQDLDALSLEVRCYLGCVDQVSETSIAKYIAIHSLHFLSHALLLPFITTVWRITKCKLVSIMQ